MTFISTLSLRFTVNLTSMESIVSTALATCLNFKGEVFLEVLDDHHQKGKFDAQGLGAVGRACNVGGAGPYKSISNNSNRSKLVSDQSIHPKGTHSLHQWLTH